MNHKPKISVIIPTYNEEIVIKRTLMAIKNQKCNIPYEIIVSDGQSSDNTVYLAKKYANVLISPNKGKSNQLNYAVSKSSGELLLFLDADTLIEPYFINKIYLLFQKHKNLFACSARVKYYDGRAVSFKLGSKNFTVTPYFFLNLNMHIWYLIKTLIGYPELMGCNITVRREIFLKVGGFKQLPDNLLGIDKVFSDSLIYLTRLMKKGKIKTLNFISVFTSARFLSIHRSLRRIGQYRSKRKVYHNLAKDINWN